MAAPPSATPEPTDVRLEEYASRCDDWDEHIFGAFPYMWVAKPHSTGCCDCTKVTVRVRDERDGDGGGKDIELTGARVCCRRIGCEKWQLPSPMGEIEMKSTCCTGSWDATYATGEKITYYRPNVCNCFKMGYELYAPNMDTARYSFLARFGCKDLCKMACPGCFGVKPPPPPLDTWMPERDGPKILKFAGKRHMANFNYMGFIDVSASYFPKCCRLCKDTRYVDKYPDGDSDTEDLVTPENTKMGTKTGIWASYMGIQPGNCDEHDRRLFLAVVLMENIRNHHDPNKIEQVPQLTNERFSLIHPFAKFHPNLTTPPTVYPQQQIL